MKKIFVPLFAISLCSVIAIPANAAACYQDSCTGKEVKDYPCPVSFYNSKNIYDSYGKIGKLTFYYSAQCDANWAKVREVSRWYQNKDIWVTVEKESDHTSQQMSRTYSRGVAITPMISGAGRVKATGNVDSGGANTYRAILTY